MADQQARPKVVLKKKKKKWVQISGLRDFKEVHLGESYVAEPNSLMNKHIDINLMELTNDMKKQNIKARFRVSTISDNKAYAEFLGYETVNSMIRRIVKRGRSKVDDSFIVETKDKIKVRIKPILLTKAKTPHSLLTKLKAKSHELIVERFEKVTFDEVIHQVISQELQRDVRDNLKKIVPLSVVDIRYFRRL